MTGRSSAPGDHRFTDVQLDALWAAILVNDVVANVDAPSAPPGLDYDRQLLVDGFGLSRELWRRGFDRLELLALVRALGQGTRLDAEQRLRFKHVRAKFKHLRFAFVLYGADHRCPTTLKAVTTAMGHLQDAFKRDDPAATRRHATILRHLLGPLPHAVLQWEVGRPKPCDPADFRRFVLRQIAALRRMLASPTMTAHQFHAARKVVSRQVSFHDDMRALTGRRDHGEMSRFLGAINGMMGRAHDDLLLAHAAGDADYARRLVALLPDLRERLNALVALYPRAGASSSASPSR